MPIMKQEKIVFKQEGFSKKELHVLYRLRELGKISDRSVPRWGSFDSDLVYAKIVIDNEKKLIIATFDEEVMDILTRGFYFGSLTDLAKSLTGKVQLHKGDKWDEKLGIQLAKAQLLRNYTAYIASKVGKAIMFAKKWCQEADEAVGIAKEHNNKISAILNKRLLDLNKKEKKNASVKRNSRGRKSTPVKGSRHAK